MKHQFIKTCKTCGNNHNGICFSSKYGEKITENETCDSWEPSLEYINHLLSIAPWYIKNKYNRYGNLMHFVNEMEQDANGKPIKLNFYDVIEKIYKLDTIILAEILNVSPQVIGHARSRYTPKKRVNNFSIILRIPTELFDNITTLDLPTIEKCKENFYEFYGNQMESIENRAREKFLEKEELEIQKEYPRNKKIFENKLLEYSKNRTISHDMSDNYKKREYVIAIKLQKDDFYGYIYYEYEYNGYGLTESIINDCITFINNLSIEDINYYNETCSLINDIELSTNINNITFNLHNANGNIISITSSINEIQNYVVSYEMIKCKGCGKKKEKRKCQSCQNFIPDPNSAKGYCSAKKDYVQRSRIICAFDYKPKE